MTAYREETNMPKIDWSYHRPGWKSCGKTQGFLADAGLEAKEQVDAKKDTYGEKQAMELLKTVSEVYAAKGKKVVHFNLKKEKSIHSRIDI